MPESLTARCLAFLIAGLLIIARGPAAHAQLSYESEPIRYFDGPLNNPLSRLQEQAAGGKVQVERDAKFGYLPAVLTALGIDPESQVLVFSKTSFQLRLISPETPRACTSTTMCTWAMSREVMYWRFRSPTLSRGPCSTRWGRSRLREWRWCVARMSVCSAIPRP